MDRHGRHEPSNETHRAVDAERIRCRAMPLDPFESINLSCPAKVNLALSVARPAEDGRHPIASWMTAVTLADRLHLERAEPGATSTFDIAFDPAAETGVAQRQVDWPLESDLAHRAHALMQEQVGKPLPVRATLRKAIPPGGGLGGGSSDAAGMLVALDRLFNLDLGRETLMELGGRLGSDVTFFVAAALGTPGALVSGFGENIEPMQPREVLHLVLIFPPFGCPTGPVYAAFDRAHDNPASIPEQADEPRVRALAAKPPLDQDAPFNDLADPACDAVPELRDALAKAREAMGVPVHVSGSGSTLFIVAPSALTCRALARKAAATTGMPAVATRTM